LTQHTPAVGRGDRVRPPADATLLSGSWRRKPAFPSARSDACRKRASSPSSSLAGRAPASYTRPTLLSMRVAAKPPIPNSRSKHLRRTPTARRGAGRGRSGSAKPR